MYLSLLNVYAPQNVDDKITIYFNACELECKYFEFIWTNDEKYSLNYYLIYFEWNFDAYFSCNISAIATKKKSVLL